MAVGTEWWHYFRSRLDSGNRLQLIALEFLQRIHDALSAGDWIAYQSHSGCFVAKHPSALDGLPGIPLYLRSYYGQQIWKRYGFVDAFNPLTGWASPDVLGIDAGISLVMAENARTQFVWNTFMSNREVNVAMERSGFRSAQDPLPA